MKTYILILIILSLLLLGLIAVIQYKNISNNTNNKSKNQTSIIQNELNENPTSNTSDEIVSKSFVSKSLNPDYTYINQEDYKKIIGYSVQNRPIMAYEYIFSKDYPTFMIIANIHGDETIGYYMMQGFLDENCFVKGRNLILIPTINPDGLYNNTRRTSTGVDLNRDFKNNTASMDNASSMNNLESKETKIVKDYIETIKHLNIRMSVVFHGGALCVSYPLDTHPEGKNQYSKSSLDELYIKTSRIYVQNHTEMIDSYTYQGGYINGADWYHIVDSIQDYLHYQSIPNITIELSQIKNPLYFFMNDKNLPLESIYNNPEIKEEIYKYWNQNKKALMEIMKNM